MSDKVFEEPKVLKESERIVSSDGRVVVTVQHVEYSIEGKKYQKLVIQTFKQDKKGFPVSRPKVGGLPIELGEQIAKAIISLSKK